MVDAEKMQTNASHSNIDKLDAEKDAGNAE